MEILKGNFEVKNPVTPEEKPETATEKFEAAALKKLGGSIAYVAKQKVVWDSNTAKAPTKAEIDIAASERK